MHALDLTGQTFGRLTALSREGSIRHSAAWLCRCVCGAQKLIAARELRTGDTKSCGCLSRDNCAEIGRARKTHGHKPNGTHGTPTYQSWRSMHDRCKPNHERADAYYERGISVCERWSSFEAFLADMGERLAGTSIDRIDNDLGYFPGNCRWATAQKQAQNRRKRSHGGQHLRA